MVTNKFQFSRSVILLVTKMINQPLIIHLIISLTLTLLQCSLLKMT